MSKTMEKIWALEKNYLVDYLSRVENATTEERKAAITQFSGEEMPDILSFDGEGKAIISIIGPLSRSGPSFLDRLFGFGGTSYAAIIESINIIKAREDISETILNMDTPGGEVAGVDNVNRAVAELSKLMSVKAVNHGMVASAGVWIASAASKIIANDPTVFTGSIGVIITAVDTSEALEKMGIRVVRIISRNAPNKMPDVKTDAGREILQDRADAIERQFIARVADGRGKSEKDVIENFGQGDLLIAFDPDKEKPSALSVGLIDEIKGQSGDSIALISEPAAAMNNDPEGNTKTPADAGDIQEDKPMTFTEVMADPALKASIDKMVAEGHKAGVEEGRAEIQARIKKIAPIMASDSYDGAVKAQGTKALNGELSLEAFESIVGVEDIRIEREKSEKAKADTTKAGETKGQSDPATAVDEVAAAIEHDKKMLGEA